MKHPFNFNLRQIVIILIAVAVGAGMFLGYLIKSESGGGTPAKDFFAKLPLVGDLLRETIKNDLTVDEVSLKVEKFSSKEDFLVYLQNSQAGSQFFSGIGQRAMIDLATPLSPTGFEGIPGTTESSGMGVGGGGGERYSETNVQVAGIDEPDIVKTDGKRIFFSAQNYNIYPATGMPVPVTENSETRMIYPPAYQDTRAVEIFEAFPPEELAKIGRIADHGNLLLKGDVLIVLSDDGRTVSAYDVKDSKNPKEKWNLSIADNAYIQAARMIENNLYLVTSTWIDYSNPCPIVPLKLNGQDMVVPCVEIYRPNLVVPIDSTYTGILLDINTGQANKKFSFVASNGQSVTYMSKNSLYLTYAVPGEMFKLVANFFTTKTADLLPKELLQHLEKLSSYDLSDQSKFSEFEIIFSKYYSGLSEDEARKLETEISNRLHDYLAEHIREINATGIAKIDLKNFEVTATGVVPGRLLNQFSLDEDKGYLRAATTVGEGFLWGFAGSAQSVNDVYVLGGSLDIIGSVKDLGLGERIYSVRFVGDRAYVVTFRQIDPFYVLDMSNPKSPQKTGELKIPGFSSYLDPLENNLILGVGQEGSQVKLSLFDTSDAHNPTELDKYILSEYWSEVAGNHHAFLADRENKIFFLPAGQSGYVFSYDDQKLVLKYVASNIQAKRAVYIDLFLYLIGETKMVVIDENNWQKVQELQL